MKRLTYFLLFVIILLITPSCKNKKSILPNVSGKAGEVIIVLNRTDWDGNLGSAVRNILASDCLFLPQREPLYSLINVIPSEFTKLFKIHRNIVIFRIDPEVQKPQIILRKDIWANTQCIIQLSAKDSEDAIQLLENNGDLIVNTIEQAERERVIKNAKQYRVAKISEEVDDIFNGSPVFPVGYKLKKKTKNFVWIADEKQYTIQGIFIYRYPAGKGDNFTVDKIIKRRNETLKKYVPGMFDNTYMTTGEFIQPEVRYLKYKKRAFAETRGLWEVYNDYMGGPFVSHSFYSEDGKEIIVIEAWVYAPKFDKRQYLRQVEALLYSFEWKSKKE